MNLFPFGENKFKRFGRVEDPYKILEIEDVPEDNESSLAEGEQPAYVGLAVSESKLRAIFAVVSLVLVVVAVRAAQLQLVNGEHYAQLAEGNRIRIEPLVSDRGIIYDRTGEKLALNVPNFVAAVRPGALPSEWSKRQRFMVELAAILDLDPIEIEERMREYDPARSSHVVVADNLTREQAILLEIMSSGDQGVFLTSGTRREYPGTVQAMSLSHILGYVGKVTESDLEENDEYLHSDFIGKQGLERTYESVMRGHYGRRRVEVDATGRLKKVVATDEGVSGHDIELSIDLALQRDAETLLREGLEKNDSHRGAVVIMNPHSGEVLSLISWPSYDNNLFAEGISSDEYARLLEDENRPMFPRATSGLLPSGSTFKLVVAAAALSENLISTVTTIVSTGGIRVGRWFFPDWKGGGHGATNVSKAIAESVNSFFYIIGGGHDLYPNIKPLGIGKIAEYARKFGLGSATGIDLPSEGEGFVPTAEWKEEQRGEPWYIGDTYHVAIGQGDILVTPLQVARYTAVFANGGKLVRPRLVKSLIDSDGTVETLPAQIDDEQVVPKDAVDAVRSGMRRAVTQGSARSLGTLEWMVAAKTGTAQWNSNRDPHAWFTSFAPYDNPEIVVTVIVEEGGEGSGVGAAVAKAIYQRYFTGEMTEVYPPPKASVTAETVSDRVVTEDEASVPTQPVPAVPPAEEKSGGTVSNVIEWMFDSQ